MVLRLELDQVFLCQVLEWFLLLVKTFKSGSLNMPVNLVFMPGKDTDVVGIMIDW